MLVGGMTIRKNAALVSAFFTLLIKALSHVNGTTVAATTTSWVSTFSTYVTTPSALSCNGSINGSGIMSSPNYPSYYVNNALCRWRLQAGPGAILQLYWPFLDLEFSYDFLVINTTYPSKPSVNEMRYTGYVSNMSLILGAVADVTFYSDVIVTRQGFAINVSSVETNALSLTLFTDCGGNISGVGYVSSPNYPNPYPNNANCRWYFQASPGWHISMTVQFFSLESEYDNLTLTIVSSNSSIVIDLRTIYESSSRTLLLQSSSGVFSFLTDSTVQKQGFSIYIYSYLPQGFSTISSYMTSSSSYGCSGSINGSGILSTPNYPSYYTNNALCRWHLQAGPGAIIQLHWPFLDLESSFDFLVINTTYLSKPSVSEMRYTGYVANVTLILGEVAVLTFYSDGSVTRQGFLINVSSVEASTPSLTPFTDCGGNISGVGYVASPNHPNPYPNNANCRWYFQTSPGWLISIYVQFFSLEREYDNLTFVTAPTNSSPESPVIDLRAVYESPSRTLVLESSRGVLSFHTDSTVQKQGFNIYLSSYIPQGFSTISSYVTSFSPYVCGGNITDEGNFTSPNYPGYYPNNALCKWFLKSGQGKVLQISMQTLSLEYSYDFLVFNSIYPNKSHPNILRFTGEAQNNTLLVLGTESSVVFTSDEIVSRQGFIVVVTSVDEPSYNQSLFEDCGGNLTGEGYLASPNYPSFYPNNANCQWYLHAYAGYIVRIEIFNINIENFYDKVTLRSTTSAADSSNSIVDIATSDAMVNRRITFPSNTAILQFRSDASVQNRGFYFYFSSVVNSSDLLQTTPWPVTPSTVAYYECGGNITGQGNFTSPLYPSVYPNMASCAWYLKAAAGKVLQIDASLIDLEEGYDYLTFTTTFLNRTLPNSYILTGYRTGVRLTLSTEAYVSFRSDSSVQRTGFLVVVSSVTAPPGLGVFYTECNTTITAPGTILSPNYPSRYPSDVDCQWTIRAPSRSSVKVQFLEFSTTVKDDVLRIFQDENITCMTPFQTYTGSSVNGSVTLGRVAVIAFSSTSNVWSSGFRLLLTFVNAAGGGSTPATTTARPMTCCGATISGSGRLRSPSYPLPYLPNTKCAWKLNRRARWPITLRINSLRLESPWDTVRVYLTTSPGVNDLPAAEYTGNVTGTTVSFNTTVLTVVFSSDESVQLAGFDITFYSNASSSRPRALAVSVLPKPGICGAPSVVGSNTRIPVSDGSDRIVGGIAAIPREWPWQVMLFNYGRFICGGSLITSQWVVTAGHCIVSFIASSFEVSLGKYNMFGTDATELRLTAAKVIRHPSYDAVALDSDIALIKLPRPVAFNAAIKPICLPVTDVTPNTLCTISGWGETQGSGSNTILRKATVPVLSRQCCKNFLGEAFTKNMFCAGYLKGGKDTCQGDSGGPLVFKNNNTFWLYGITSWGIGCGRPYYPGVYTRVPGFINWIAQTISQN